MFTISDLTGADDMIISPLLENMYLSSVGKLNLEKFFEENESLKIKIENLKIKIESLKNEIESLTKKDEYGEF